MWFKKKAAIGSSFNPNQAPDGRDYTKSTSYVGFYNPVPSIATEPLSNPSDYFYLPALGYYYSGTLNAVGWDGHYWSSTPYPFDTGFAYDLFFSSGFVNIGNGFIHSRDYGLRRWVAE